EKPTLAERQLHKLHGTSGNDGDDGSPDAVERPLHPGESAEAEIKGGDEEHHDERGQDEGDAHERRPEYSCSNPAKINGKLSGERSRSELCKGKATGEVLLGYPASPLDEVPLHVANKSNGSTKSERSKPEEVK